MRSSLDRLRHALSFEILGLLMLMPLGAAVFHVPIRGIGVVTVVSATLATLWNMVYNYMFDLAHQRLAGTTQKSWRLRILHAVFFELGLLLVLIPFIAWYLELSFWQAFVMDGSFSLFYLLYAFCFNWAYDRVFPLPGWKGAPPAGDKASPST